MHFFPDALSVPTIAEITGAASPEELRKMDICGKSLVPVMQDPNISGRQRQERSQFKCLYTMNVSEANKRAEREEWQKVI